jgi:hypothetical protein
MRTSSDRQRAKEYRRTAEHLRDLSKNAKSSETQEEFSRFARMYERLARETTHQDGTSRPGRQPPDGDIAAASSD